MNVIRYPDAIDPARYAPEDAEPECFYGLPREIVFCRKCTYSNQKPNSDREYKHTGSSRKPTVAFDDDGVCSACRIAERKASIDWSARDAELRALLDSYRRSDGRYDCLVPGSGGKDSFYAAYKLKYEYGMNPLTVTWAPHLYTDWGWHNFEAWIGAGFDNFLFTPNGRVHRLLTRLALENMFHPFQPFIMGQMYYPPRMAAKLDIPLVFYGENPSEYGNDARAYDTPSKDRAYFAAAGRDEMFLAGVSIAELIESFGLNLVDLMPYLPPDPGELAEKRIDVQYLGYYLPWHPQECYYYAVEKGGFRAAPERTAGTYGKYSSIDDKIDDLHYFTTFIKFGIGRATYDSAQEVRNGDITREEAVALVRRFDGEYSERFEAENFAFLSIRDDEFPDASPMFEQGEMDRAYFDALTNRFRSPHLWMLEDNRWRLRRTAHDDESGERARERMTAVAEP